MENLAQTGIRSMDRPARSELLYRLSYRGPLGLNIVKKLAKCYIWSIAVYGAEYWSIAVYGVEYWSIAVYGAEYWSIAVYGAEYWRFRAVDQKNMGKFEILSWKKTEKVRSCEKWRSAT